MSTTHSMLLEQSLHAATWQEREAAKTALKAAGTAALPALEQALGHADWKTRRHVAQLLDNALDNTNVHILMRALHDQNAVVRRNSLHSLICEDCKPEGCWTVDMTGTLLELASTDCSPRVRMRAIGYLWSRPPEQRMVDVLRALEDSHPHPKVRARAKQMCARVEQRLATAAATAATPATTAASAAGP